MITNQSSIELIEALKSKTIEVNSLISGLKPKYSEVTDEEYLVLLEVSSAILDVVNLSKKIATVESRMVDDMKAIETMFTLLYNKVYGILISNVTFH